MSQTETRNISEYIQTEANINLFVDAIADLWAEAHTKETDDHWTILPKQCHQLLWVIAAYLKEAVAPSERTIESMQKLLPTCLPLTKRHDDTTFDTLIGDCNIKNIQDNYAYFKNETFGIHSNCYRETVRLCQEALQELSQEDIEKALKNTEDKEEPSSATTLFGTLDGLTGQEHQILHYEAYPTALHEAGHAVAFYLLGIDFSGVTIIPADSNMGHVRPALKKPAGTPREEAIITYAGAVGEAVALKHSHYSAWSSRGDYREATKIIKEEVIQDLSSPHEAYQYVFIDADILGLADQESPYIIYETIKRCAAIQQETIDLITEHKDMVIALAEELVKKQSMPSEEVIAFLDAWQSQHNPQ